VPRYVVIGAGGIGGGVGGLLARAGCAVELVARGAHLAALQRDGLRVRLPSGGFQESLPAWGHVHQVDWRPDDVVLLAVKCQDTLALVEELRVAAPPSIRVLTLQNGLDSGDRVAAAFSTVACGMVWVPAVHLVPGEVRLHGVPGPGVLVIGGWPQGAPDWVTAAAEDLVHAGFVVQVTDEIAPVLGGKFLTNLGGALQALCGSGDGVWAHAQRVVDEGARVLQAAGVPVLPVAELLAGPCGDVGVAPVDGHDREGGSTHQSLARGSSLETGELNGLVVRLGRRLGLPTPLNDRVCDEMDAAVAEGRGAGETPLDVLESTDRG